jgi:2-keto-4-pentenoate hydratase/2-oxohepta-3-ene-1,7-dioic acid hydratase in catechol pathway
MELLDMASRPRRRQQPVNSRERRFQSSLAIHSMDSQRPASNQQLRKYECFHATSPRVLANRSKLLSPLESTPIFMCIGLNYAHHAKEANVCTLPIF